MNAPDILRTKSGVFVYFQAHCSSGVCDWVCPDRRQMESDAWGDLVAHLRNEHGGNVREVRIRRTVTEELVEQE